MLYTSCNLLQGQPHNQDIPKEQTIFFKHSSLKPKDVLLIFPNNEAAEEGYILSLQNK